MKKIKFTEQQIAFVLRQIETGTRVVKICHKLEISELRRLKQLDEENRQLKWIVVDMSLEKQYL